MSSPKRYHNTVLDTAKSLVSPLGGTVEVSHKGRHSCLVIQIAGKTRKVGMSGTPKDFDGARWSATREIVKTIREMTSDR